MTVPYNPYAGTNAAVTPTGQTTTGEIRTADGHTRTYRLYVPSALDKRTAAPLVVALHGGMGSGAQFAANSGFDGLAEANGFIVAYPDGIGAPRASRLQTWNGGYCCGPAVEANVDDVAFVRQLIELLRSQLLIDPQRTYAAGHSNGAIMAYRLACELSDQIVAIGVQAGSLGVDSCSLARPVSVFHQHGTADTNHPIDGGKGTGVAGVEFRSARAAVDAFVNANGCVPPPVPGADPANPDLAVTTWQSCRGDTAVQFVAVTGATHAWMGHDAASRLGASLVGEPYPKLDASRAVWSFLAAHPRR
ncbi:MAG: alpha/beta hydrolase family esterase [Acidimicrobiia bacterium]